MPKKIEWKLEKGFVLGGFAYHDGSVVELTYANTNMSDLKSSIRLTLGILNTESEIVKITFNTVRLMNITELWVTACVDDIEINRERDYVDGLSPDTTFWGIIRPISRFTNHTQRADEIKKLIDLYKGEYFVRLYASYGASMALICNEIVVEVGA